MMTPDTLREITPEKVIRKKKKGRGSLDV